MTVDSSSCPMSSKKVLERYFIENRSRLIDIAAFLDRMDRTQDHETVQSDSRWMAFRKALEVLLESESQRVEKVQSILSDHTSDSKTTDCC